MVNIFIQLSIDDKSNAKGVKEIPKKNIVNPLPTEMGPQYFVFPSKNDFLFI